jgi:very-short-patch-repair endonuclease
MSSIKIFREKERYKQYLKDKAKYKPEFKKKKKRKPKKKKIFEVAQKYRNKILKQENKIELKFKEFLIENEINYEYQRIFIIGNEFKIADFYLPDKKMVIELDGNQHRNMKEEDQFRTDLLIANTEVDEVLRIWNWQLKDLDNKADDILKIIE